MKLTYRIAQLNLVLVLGFLILGAAYGVVSPEGVLWLVTTIGVFALARLAYKVHGR